MATGTPTIARLSSAGPVRSFGPRTDTRVVVSFSVGTYATGGAPLTLPAEVKGLSLVGVHILNPIPVVAGDRIYSWNGSGSAPTIFANVITTGAQVVNGTDLSAVTLHAELIFGG